MIIQIPVVLRDNQLDSALELIGTMPSYVTPGIQVYRGPVDLMAQVSDEEIQRQLALVPRDFVVSIHAPISDNTPDRRFNLAYAESEEYIRQNLRLAESVGLDQLPYIPIRFITKDQVSLAGIRKWIILNICGSGSEDLCTQG